MSFPLCGNDLFKPLDSGLRRNDVFVWILACAGQLRVSSAACSRCCPTTSAACPRRGFTAYVPVGVSINDGRTVGMAINPFQPPSSFMDRKSCMRREGRMPVAAQRRLACMDAGGRAASGTSRRGIQEGRPGDEGMAEFIGCPHPVIAPVVGIPALREWIM